MALLLIAAAPASEKAKKKQAKAAADSAESEAAPAKWDVDEAPGPEYDATIDVTEGTWINLDVSPQGDEIVFDLLGDLYRLPISGGEAEALTSGPKWDMQPRFSPDGSEIAFTSDRDGGDNIWVMKRDGSEPRAISSEDFRLLNNPVWSPDGEYIAARKHFTSRRSLGGGEIWLFHRSGTGSGLQLNEKPNEQKDLGEPAFSPDGRHVYFSRDTSPGETFEYSKDSNGQIYTIHQIDRETGEIETVVSGLGGAVRPTPSPDGRYLAFVRRVRFESTLFLHDLESGENRPIYGPLDRDMQEIWAIHGVYPNFAWMPDCGSIVVWAKGKLHRVDIDSGSASEISFRARQTHRLKEALRFPVEVAPERFHTKMIRWAEVSPSGDRVVFQALGRLYLRDLPEGTPRRLTDQDDHFELYPSFSRDGQSVVFATWDDRDLGAIRIVSIAAGPSGPGTLVTRKPGHYIEPVLSPDGDHVVFRKIGGGFLRSPLWSKEPGLYVTKTNGEGEPFRLHRGGSEPHFGAGSDRVFFVERMGAEERQLKSIQLDGLEERAHLESANATRIRVSPDGRWVAFVERFDAYAMPFVAASKPIQIGPKIGSLPYRQVSRDAGDGLHWSGDASKLHWTVGPELFERSLADSFVFVDGSPHTSSDDLPKPPESGLDIGFDQPTDIPSGRVALVGAKIVTMAGEADGRIFDPGTVVVDGSRIVALGATADTAVPADAHRVDASGKVILPGLIDVHWHGGQGTAEIQPESNWQNYASLAFGVTTAHDPSNDTSTFFAASELQRAGVIVGPRLYSTGTILYGAAGDAKAIVETLEDARSHLRRHKAVGAFTVKSYNQPRRDQRQKIVAAARELEMMVVNEGGALFNHNMSMVVDGHTGIEHSLSVGAIYDDVLQLWGQSRVGNTPTLVVAFGGIEGERYWYQHTNVWENERLLTFVPRERVDARSRRRMMAPEEEYNHFATAKICKQLHDAGVSIQVGAHGQREGLGAHWEMWMLEQGGMTAHEALRAGTIQGARYLGLDRDLGSLEIGKLADLIVLDRDPLENLRNSESVRYVMVNGRLYDAATMNEIGNHPRSRGALFWEE